MKRVYDMFDERLHRWEIDGSAYTDPEIFLESCWSLVAKAIDSVKGNKKVYFKLDILLARLDLKSGEESLDNSGFPSELYEMIATSDDLAKHWPEIMTTMLTRLSKFQDCGSGWVMKKINKLIVSADIYNPIAGSSYIELPKVISDRKAVINIENSDESCFPLSVAAALLRMEDPSITKLQRETNRVLLAKKDELNMNGIELPVKLADIDKFERNNPGLNIMVFGLTETKDSRETYIDGEVVTVPEVIKVSHLRIKRRPDKSLTTIRLLMWGNKDGNFHYSPITNLSRLLSKQISENGHKKVFCNNCGNPFGSEKVLLAHEEMCYTKECQRTVYPDKFIEFDKWRCTQKVPFAVYSDIESYNTKFDVKSQTTNTVKLSEQTPSGLGYAIVGPRSEFEPTYKKFPTVEEYTKSLTSDLMKIYWKWFHDDKPLSMTDEDTVRYEKSSECYVCGCHLVQGKNKVRDHDHFTGKFRGAACSKCNLAMKKPKFVPVYFHNLEGYDGHLIINEIAKYGRITCIPHTKEKYTSFSLMLREGFGGDGGFEVRFLDSLKFLGKGLANLVKTLRADDFELTNRLFPNLTDEQRKLLMRKGVYPYDWVDFPSKIRKRKLPPIREFYNTLSEEDCSEKDYDHAQNVWVKFGMKTFQEYHDLYLKSDILQLADIYEKFRVTCMTHYGLDPAWDFTTPGFAWKSMLKVTGVRLRTNSDPDMFLFVESSIRGGISVITKRHAVANHQYMENYDPEKPSVFIIDQNMNNLYGGAECEKLPTYGFEWMTEDELTEWESLPENVGCFLEVDLKIPHELHDKFNDYPLACERIPVGKSTKLVPNLYDKTKYVIHYEELRQCVKHGLVITKIHRGLKFRQSRWMKPFVDLNTKLRTAATTKFEQDFFKMMNCAVYRKTVENVRNWRDIKLITKGEKNPSARANKYISRPNYKATKQFSDSLMALELGKPTTIMDKPIYVGASILSISKVAMVRYFYEYVKVKWGEKVRLLFTDTDSLCLEIHTDDYYGDIAGDVGDWFDTSNYPSDHPAVRKVNFPVGKNKKALGKMKDETGGENIIRFLGMRPKMYAMKLENDEEIKRLKGIKRMSSGK